MNKKLRTNILTFLLQIMANIAKKIHVIYKQCTFNRITPFFAQIPFISHNILLEQVLLFVKDGTEAMHKDIHSSYLFFRYSKACQNNFDFSGYKKGVEPFAQLVWKSTAFLGMGKAVSNRDGNLCTYIVARYSPEGDKNSFAENVLKGTFSKNGICSSSCVVKGNVAHTDGKNIL